MEHSYVGHSILCSKCGNIKFDAFDEISRCEYCGGETVQLSLSLDEIGTMSEEEKDEIRFSFQPLEKYDNFAWTQRKIKDRQRHEEIYNKSAQFKVTHPECPYCHNRNTKKITTASKALNTGMFGLFGTKRNYQWHCNNCNSNF